MGWLTFYDAALRFVTSRRQYRAGNGGRPGLFLSGRRIGGNGWQTGALERFPITWNHVIEKESLKFKKSWSMSLSKKSINFFGDML